LHFFFRRHVAVHLFNGGLRGCYEIRCARASAFTAKPPGKCRNRRLCLSAPNDTCLPARNHIVGAVEPENKAGAPVRPRNHTPALRGLVQIGVGLIFGLLIHDEAAGQCQYDLRSPFLCFSSPKAAREPTYRAQYNSTNDPQKRDG